jgi:cystathionine beta-lyase family protein involved in aluminum resistance
MSYKLFGIREELRQWVESREEALRPLFSRMKRIKENNTLRVMEALSHCGLRDMHFHSYTGYAYGDPGRDVTEEVYARVFGTEDALVRPAIASGTHALSLLLSGCLRSGDELLIISGAPYDTLHGVIGINCQNGATLTEKGVIYSEVALTEEGTFDAPKVKEALRSLPKMVYIQRSQGYSFRRSFTESEIGEMISLVREISPRSIVALDNCYGEFTACTEPGHWGADIFAGSLIKNPGGGLVASGGYIAGRADLIEQCAYALTAPGLGKEIGGTFGTTRTVLQGLLFAPTVTYHALKSAVLFAKCYEDLGYEVNPPFDAERQDIIEAIKLEKEEKLLAFCEEIQKASPVDAHVLPIPGDMPGYTDPVIMAAGTFVQGSSIELSADGPLREPFTVYLQGALLYEQGKLALMRTIQRLHPEL